MKTTPSSSRRTREAQRLRWAAYVRPHWKRLERNGTLSKREASVLSLRLGLASDHALTQRQIARRFGITEQTAARLERDARAKVIAALTVEGHKA